MDQPVGARRLDEHAAPRPQGVARSLRAPHRRLAIMIGVSILLGCAVVALTTVELRNAQRPIDEVREQYLPPSADLQTAAMVLSRVTPTYLDALTRPPAERALLFSSLVTPNTRYQSAFERYEQHAVGLPGEEELQRKFRAASRGSSETSVALLGADTLTADQVTNAISYSAAMTESLTALRGLYTERIAEESNAASSEQQRTRTVVLVSSVAVLTLIIGASIWILRSLRVETRKSELQAERNELEARLQRALGMDESEEEIFATVTAAVASAVPAISVELLVADSSRAHLRQVAASCLAPSGACPVGAPTSCPAAVHGQTQRFESSTAIDACPHLRDRDAGAIGAVCVPVTITGRPMGVLHATTAVARPPTEEQQLALELIARRAGERISLLRAFARSEMQAHTDPLTGLLNRRSIEASAQDLLESGDAYVVAYADLDHFKVLNDVQGHDAGDRALRLFARVLRDSIRPTDLPARYGGEEFLVILPDCSADDAVMVMERVREQLRVALHDSGSPDFTVSVGIAPSSPNGTFSEITEHADRALLRAKANGRDRVVVAAASEGAPTLGAGNGPAGSAPL